MSDTSEWSVTPEHVETDCTFSGWRGDPNCAGCGVAKAKHDMRRVEWQIQKRIVVAILRRENHHDAADAVQRTTFEQYADMRRLL